jgi:hypothetical protein
MSQHRSSTRKSAERPGHAETPSFESARQAHVGARDRRVSRRVNLRAPLTVRWAGEEGVAKIRLLDISRTGFRFECSRIHSIGNHGHAESIKPEDTRIDSDFVIVWTYEVKPGCYHYGARFVKSVALRRSA